VVRKGAGYTPGVNVGQGKRARFATTRWTLVVAAGAGPSADADAALANLYAAYWYPLYAFLRVRGQGAEDAQDLVQAFFVHLLEKKALTQAQPTRGRFRSFLLASLKNFAANEHDRRSAMKRGGGAPILPLEIEGAEGRFQLDPSTDETPDTLFDRQWALTLLDRVLTRLRDETTRRKPLQFEQLKVYLTGEDPDHTYAEAAAALGMSEGAVKVAVHRLRRRFRELLREEIAHTVSSDEDIDDEIRHLWSSVGR
jgi:RNA polymerase sigma factor (sigma-70 family)